MTSVEQTGTTGNLFHIKGALSRGFLCFGVKMCLGSFKRN